MPIKLIYFARENYFEKRIKNGDNEMKRKIAITTFFVSLLVLTIFGGCFAASANDISTQSNLNIANGKNVIRVKVQHSGAMADYHPINGAKVELFNSDGVLKATQYTGVFTISGRTTFEDTNEFGIYNGDKCTLRVSHKNFKTETRDVNWGEYFQEFLLSSKSKSLDSMIPFFLKSSLLQRFQDLFVFFYRV